MLNLNSLIIPCSEGIWNPTRALAASPSLYRYSGDRCFFYRGVDIDAPPKAIPLPLRARLPRPDSLLGHTCYGNRGTVEGIASEQAINRLWLQ